MDKEHPFLWMKHKLAWGLRIGQYVLKQLFSPCIMKTVFMKTVLIVVSEDIHLLHALQQLVRNVLSELRKYQAKVLVASSAGEAINSIQQQTVDVLLVDHILPRMSAFDLIATIPGGSAGITKVLMTKHPLTSADLTKAAEMGIDAVLERPVGREKLKEVLQKVFNRKS